MKNISVLFILATLATTAFGQRVSKEIFFCSELESNIVVTDSFQILFLDRIEDNFKESPKEFSKTAIVGDSMPVLFEQIDLFSKPERIAEIIYATILTPVALSIEPAFAGKGVLWFAFESEGKIVTVRIFQKNGIWNFNASIEEGAIVRGLLFEPN